MYPFLFFLAIFSTLLQTTLLPSLSIYGGVFELSLILALLLIFGGNFRQAAFFSLASALFLALFSGESFGIFLLPIIVVLACLYLFHYRRIITGPSIYLSIPFFFFAVAVAEIVEMLLAKQSSLSSLRQIVASGVISTVLGSILYYFQRKIQRYLNPQVEPIRAINRS
ncbi:MAG: hypothetical protein NTW79_01015 [Candidatus Berkelbacteria bacterium]|nr:hypothetical protein [Candidatus Berkelbacteria bacterium]